MSRIDVKTLVLAFEKRIEALEKNPPDKVPTSVIINMLERSIDEIIKDHFLSLIKKQIDNNLENEFKSLYKNFIKKTLKDILSDSNFRSTIESRIKSSLIINIR